MLHLGAFGEQSGDISAENRKYKAVDDAEQHESHARSWNICRIGVRKRNGKKRHNGDSDYKITGNNCENASTHFFSFLKCCFQFMNEKLQWHNHSDICVALLVGAADFAAVHAHALQAVKRRAAILLVAGIHHPHPINLPSSLDFVSIPFAATRSRQKRCAISSSGAVKPLHPSLLNSLAI
jgi:hypothetical protein